MAYWANCGTRSSAFLGIRSRICVACMAYLANDHIVLDIAIEHPNLLLITKFGKRRQHLPIRQSISDISLKLLYKNIALLVPQILEW